MFYMGTLDWIVLGIFCFGLIGIIIWVLRQKEETSTDYFLAGRDATWLAIGSSIFASNIGSEHLLGLAGAGASSGMAMAHWEMHGWLILILGWVFVPFYSRSMVYTMPEFLERRYNSSARSLLSIISLISYVLTKVAVTVYAGGVVFTQVFGIERICNINQAPFGDSMMSLIRSPKDTVFPWTGVLLGSAIIGFWYWCTDQYIVQRVLSGRNQKESRRGAILGAAFKLTPVFIFLIPGMIAYSLNAKGMIALSDSDTAFSVLVKELLPLG